MEFVSDLGLFSGKVIVLTLAIGVILVLFFALLAKARHSKPLLTIENMNKRFEDMARALKGSILDAKAQKQDAKLAKKKAKAEKSRSKERKRIYVLEFHGDIRAGHVENLREEISAILTVGRRDLDEVLVIVESPGGMAHAYGLAAAQLLRARHAGLHLTIAVDKVAASGGYMMACTATKILAAPFAIIGSIGVVAQVPNFHRLLKKHDVDYEEITAGEFKRTISIFGEITDKGRRKFLDQLEETHALFKTFVKDCRPKLNLDEVATGEYWFGRRALELNLVDEIISSDDYLFSQREDADIYKVEMKVHKRWSEKLAENIASLVVGSYEKTWSKSQESNFLA
ncbi:MAG: protease SohB, partial [Bdellovibrionaceae bacterium]|nr:protease SohB [Pseudobdellovibrionaceae bacterium]